MGYNQSQTPLAGPRKGDMGLIVPELMGFQHQGFMREDSKNQKTLVGENRRIRYHVEGAAI